MHTILRLTLTYPVGGAVAEWSKALLVRENKRKSKRSQVRPRTWAPFKKNPLTYPQLDCFMHDDVLVSISALA